MSPSGLVSSRWVNPLPGPVVLVQTMLAPTNRSTALVVIMALLLLVALSPVAAALTSSGLSASLPLYPKIQISGATAAALKVNVTAFAPAVAAEMFLA